MYFKILIDLTKYLQRIFLKQGPKVVLKDLVNDVGVPNIEYPFEGNEVFLGLKLDMVGLDLVSNLYRKVLFFFCLIVYNITWLYLWFHLF